jgi:hypothetical protein
MEYPYVAYVKFLRHKNNASRMEEWILNPSCVKWISQGKGTEKKFHFAAPIRLKIDSRSVQNSLLIQIGYRVK